MTLTAKAGAREPPCREGRPAAPRRRLLFLCAFLLIGADVHAGNALGDDARSLLAGGAEAELVCAEATLVAPTGWDFNDPSCRTRVSERETGAPASPLARALAKTPGYPARSMTLANGEIPMRCYSSAATANDQATRCWIVARGVDVAGIVLCFFFFWPAAFAFLGWKLLGYPGASDAKAFLESRLRHLIEKFRPCPPFASSGNAAFEQHRRREIERLEAERRRLDEDARAFADFVDELKRAKDQDEFAAFMVRRAKPAGA